MSPTERLRHTVGKRNRGNQMNRDAISHPWWVARGLSVTKE